MPKLRKMLSTNLEDARLKELMHLIETQSKATIAKWAVEYVRLNYLHIYEEGKKGDKRPHNALNAAEQWLQGRIKLPQAKQAILICHEAARELDTLPALQAMARTAGQAASAIHVATHALGIVFYGTAAFAYDRAGPNASQEKYDQLASEEFDRILQSFKKACIANEPNPVKVKWGC